MSYAEQSAQYRNMEERSRYEMCIKEQGFIYAVGSDPTDAALGAGVVGGNSNDIDAIVAGICTSPNWQVLSNDPDLLAAVQSVWSTVAAARYPTV